MRAMSENRGMELRQRFPNTWKYQPFCDAQGSVCEDVNSYVMRMQNTILPDWPEEPLKEWLHLHAGDPISTYSSLGFELFRFRKVDWPTEKIPGREVYLDDFCDPNDDIQVRANRGEWVSRYMLDHGTWNTPIILLANRRKTHLPNGEELRTPYHLLEGHSRLCSFQSLRASNRAAPSHSVWLVTLIQRPQN